MLLSVVVPVRDDAHRLERCLRSIHQSPELGPSEVIVADNGSTDGSPSVAAQAGAQVLVLPGVRVSTLRNRAARLARGCALAFVDADHELGEGWIAATRDLLKDSSIAAAGAVYMAPLDGTWVQLMYGALRGRTIGLHDTDWLGSGNMVVRKEAFDRVGGFDESLDACEDVDLCRRLRAAGYRIVADERLRSVHHGDPPSLRALFRAERWRGRNNMRASLRGPVGLRDLPSVVFPVLVLASLVTLAAALALSFVFGVHALTFGTWGLAVIIGLAALRATRMMGRLGQRSVALLAQAFIVALVYEVARALALITRAPHHRAARR